MALDGLTACALAPASKIRLDAGDFKCAWFDESHCFEFFPLHAVYRDRYDATRE